MGYRHTAAAGSRLAGSLAALLLAVAGCGDGGGSSGSHGSGGSGASATTTYGMAPACTGGDTPIINGDAPDPTWTWNDPHVLKVGSEYWMYASSTVAFDFPVRLYRLTASDDHSFTRNPTTPILDVGATGEWDAGGVETPAVVFFGGKYHLFWTGYPIAVNEPGYSVFDFRIGHATSDDGVAWTRDPGNPVVAPSTLLGTNLPENDWYYWIVGEPGPVVYNGKIYLYFTAVGLDHELSTSLQVVGVTTSSDGSTWSAPQFALRPDQTLYPASGHWVGYSTPNAIAVGSTVHLFFDVAQDLSGDGSAWKQIRLHHAKSLDGVTGWVQDSTAMYSAPFSAWATEEVRSSDAFMDGTTLRFYFAGHTADYNFGIGESTCVLAP